MNLFGLHHISAIASSHEDCLDFYGGLLGLSLVAEHDSGTVAFAPGDEQAGGVLSFAVTPGAAPGGLGSSPAVRERGGSAPDPRRCAMRLMRRPLRVRSKAPARFSTSPGAAGPATSAPGASA